MSSNVYTGSEAVVTMIGAAVVTMIGAAAAWTHINEILSTVGVATTAFGVVIALRAKVKADKIGNRHRQQMAELEELRVQLLVCHECMTGTPLNSSCPFLETKRPTTCPLRLKHSA